MITIAGQRVKIRTGSKSQTVRLYGLGERMGMCEHTVRFRPPATTERDLAAQNFASVDDMLGYLTRDLGGTFEAIQSQGSVPLHSGAARQRLPRRMWPRDHVALSPWGIGARAATERAINLLVDEFCVHPLQHRVEHSIHTRLFHLLATQSELQTEIQFSGHVTQPIHKEWPEFISRPEKKGRRGNFDLAILAPEIVADATLEEFRGGWIRPTIVIEVGLDYGHTHLVDDIKKLQNSQVHDSYVVHLMREGVPDNFDLLEDHIRQSPIKCAYARHTSTGYRFMKIDDGENEIKERHVQR